MRIDRLLLFVVKLTVIILFAPAIVSIGQYCQNSPVYQRMVVVLGVVIDFREISQYLSSTSWSADFIFFWTVQFFRFYVTVWNMLAVRWEKCRFYFNLYLGNLEAFWKATVSFMMSVHLATWENWTPTGWIFANVAVWVLFKNVSRKFHSD
jgi:hypothetical protein